METKKDKFIRLATKRTQDALNKLRLIGNLSNKNNYDYSDADKNKIFTAIDKQVRKMKSKFESKGKEQFKL